MVHIQSLLLPSLHPHVSSGSVLGLQSSMYMHPSMLPCSKTAKHSLLGQMMTDDENLPDSFEVNVVVVYCPVCALGLTKLNLKWNITPPCAETLHVCRLTWPTASGAVLLLVKIFFIYTALTLGPAPGTMAIDHEC